MKGLGNSFSFRHEWFLWESVLPNLSKLKEFLSLLSLGQWVCLTNIKQLSLVFFFSNGKNLLKLLLVCMFHPNYWGKVTWFPAISWFVGSHRMLVNGHLWCRVVCVGAPGMQEDPRELGHVGHEVGWTGTHHWLHLQEPRELRCSLVTGMTRA